MYAMPSGRVSGPRVQSTRNTGPRGQPWDCLDVTQLLVSNACRSEERSISMIAGARSEKEAATALWAVFSEVGDRA